MSPYLPISQLCHHHELDAWLLEAKADLKTSVPIHFLQFPAN
jgi:hypothetical protein